MQKKKPRDVASSHRPATSSSPSSSSSCSRQRCLSGLILLAAMLVACYLSLTRKHYNSVTWQSLTYFARPQGSNIRWTPIRSRAAWRGEDLRGETRKTEWMTVLTSQDITELQAAVQGVLTRNITMHQLSKDDFHLSPRFLAKMAGWRTELEMGGLGFQVLRGVPVETWTEEEASIFFWGFGLHLGRPGAQDNDGHLLGHVRDIGGDHATQRQYMSAGKIDFHCDAADVVGLLCLQPALRGGGVSRIISSVSVYNEMLKRYPSLVPLLYRPLLLDTRGSGGIHYFAIEPVRYYEKERTRGEGGGGGGGGGGGTEESENEPKNTNTNLKGGKGKEENGEEEEVGELRTFFHQEYFRSVRKYDGVAALSREESELLTAYESILEDPSLYLEMSFQAGDVQLLSNHVTLHARTAYIDALAPIDQVEQIVEVGDTTNGNATDDVMNEKNEKKIQKIPHALQRHLLRLWLSTEDKQVGSSSSSSSSPFFPFSPFSSSFKEAALKEYSRLVLVGRLLKEKMSQRWFPTVMTTH